MYFNCQECCEQRQLEKGHFTVTLQPLVSTNQQLHPLLSTLKERQKRKRKLIYCYFRKHSIISLMCGLHIQYKLEVGLGGGLVTGHEAFLSFSFAVFCRCRTDTKAWKALIQVNSACFCSSVPTLDIILNSPSRGCAEGLA